MANWMEAKEDFPTASAIANYVNAEASKLAEHMEEDQQVVWCQCLKMLNAVQPEPDHAMVDTLMAVLNEEHTLISNAEQVKAAVPDATRTKLVENTGPLIHVVPATPQDSQEKAKDPKSMALPLPPLLAVTSPANANCHLPIWHWQLQVNISGLSPSPCSSPPPAQL